MSEKILRSTLTSKESAESYARVSRKNYPSAKYKVIKTAPGRWGVVRTTERGPRASRSSHVSRSRSSSGGKGGAGSGSRVSANIPVSPGVALKAGLISKQEAAEAEKKRAHYIVTPESVRTAAELEKTYGGRVIVKPTESKAQRYYQEYKKDKAADDAREKAIKKAVMGGAPLPFIPKIRVPTGVGAFAESPISTPVRVALELIAPKKGKGRIESAKGKWWDIKESFVRRAAGEKSPAAAALGAASRSSAETAPLVAFGVAGSGGLGATAKAVTTKGIYPAVTMYQVGTTIKKPTKENIFWSGVMLAPVALKGAKIVKAKTTGPKYTVSTHAGKSKILVSDTVKKVGIAESKLVTKVSKKPTILDTIKARFTGKAVKAKPAGTYVSNIKTAFVKKGRVVVGKSRVVTSKVRGKTTVPHQTGTVISAGKMVGKKPGVTITDQLAVAKTRVGGKTVTTTVAGRHAAKTTGEIIYGTPKAVSFADKTALAFSKTNVRSVGISASTTPGVSGRAGVADVFTVKTTPPSSSIVGGHLLKRSPTFTKVVSSQSKAISDATARAMTKSLLPSPPKIKAPSVFPIAYAAPTTKARTVSPTKKQPGAAQVLEPTTSRVVNIEKITEKALKTSEVGVSQIFGQSTKQRRKGRGKTRTTTPTRPRVSMIEDLVPKVSLATPQATVQTRRMAQLVSSRTLTKVRPRVARPAQRTTTGFDIEKLLPRLGPAAGTVPIPLPVGPKKRKFKRRPLPFGYRELSHPIKEILKGWKL